MCGNGGKSCEDATKDDSKKSEDKDGKIKLTFSTSVYVEEPHQKAIDALLEAYSKKEPNVDIEILGAGYDGYWDNITTEILSNIKRYVCGLSGKYLYI